MKRRAMFPPNLPLTVLLVLLGDCGRGNFTLILTNALPSGQSTVAPITVMGEQSQQQVQLTVQNRGARAPSG